MAVDSPGTAASRAHRGARRAPAERAYLAGAVIRCALYLGPLSVAVAGAPQLGAVVWPGRMVLLALGWAAAQGLASLGAAVARTAGPAAAARLVAGGFAAATGLWGAYVWVAPAALLGHSRVLALVVGAAGLIALSTVTAALVTRSEAAVIRYSLPCWLLAAVSLAASLGLPWAARAPIATLLPAAIVVAAIRAYRPVIGRAVPDRPRLARGDQRRAAGYLVIGAAQAACVALLQRSGHTVLAAVPILISVPILEAVVGWYRQQVEAGLDLTDSNREYGRHMRTVATVTVAALLPPLAAGLALTAAAYRLPGTLTAVTTTRDGVLALAAGTLLGGVFAITFLLAARGRTAVAATLAAAAPLAIAGLPLLPGPQLPPLPGIVAVLSATHLAGLLTVAHTAADHRRSS